MGVPEPELPLVCAVVPVFNRAACTLRFLRGFEAVSYPNKAVVVADDGSTDHTSELVGARFKQVHVIRGDGTMWWSGATNAAIRYALEKVKAEYVLTINDDVIMDEDFLFHMVEVARRDPKHIVGCCLFSQRDKQVVWSIGARPVFCMRILYELGFHGRSWERVRGEVSHPFPVDTMPGNGVLLPRSVFEEVGFYRESSMPQYHADADLVYRAKKEAGYKPVISLKSHLYNQINPHPLVGTRWEVVFSKKSDLYLPSLWASIATHGRFPFRMTNLLLIYLNAFYPSRLRGISRRLVRFLSWFMGGGGIGRGASA